MPQLKSIAIFFARRHLISEHLLSLSTHTSCAHFLSRFLYLTIFHLRHFHRPPSRFLPCVFGRVSARLRACRVKNRTFHPQGERWPGHAFLARDAAYVARVSTFVGRAHADGHGQTLAAARPRSHACTHKSANPRNAAWGFMLEGTKQEEEGFGRIEGSKRITPEKFQGEKTRCYNSELGRDTCRERLKQSDETVLCMWYK